LRYNNLDESAKAKLCQAAGAQVKLEL